MYLGYQNGQVKFYTEEQLNQVLYNLEKVEETDSEYVFNGEEYVLKDKAWEEKQAQKEHDRLDLLSMTRSDFFDGMIMAFGLDSKELRAIVEQALNSINITPVEIKVALNNYDNALNFYRKHTLFTLLSAVEIPINKEMTLVFTSDIWNKFFDETSKRNPEAYKELQKAIQVEPEIEPIEEENSMEQASDVSST